jgi:predicted RNA-binding protein Jag
MNQQFQNLSEKIEKIISLTGLKNASVNLDEPTRRINIIVDEDEWFSKHIPDLVKELKLLISLIARKESIETNFFIDINNYRKERERLIIELAKAAAQKSITLKTEVRLPAMNAYERRLVHMELSMRPDIKTESIGEGKERGVVIKPIL